jgi:hypothetical protein
VIPEFTLPISKFCSIGRNCLLKNSACEVISQIWQRNKLFSYCQVTKTDFQAERIRLSPLPTTQFLRLNKGICNTKQMCYNKRAKVLPIDGQPDKIEYRLNNRLKSCSGTGAVIFSYVKAYILSLL